MLDPLGAGLHVGKFVHGLGGAAVAADAVICENAAVTELAKVSGSVRDVNTTVASSEPNRSWWPPAATGAVTPWLQRRVIGGQLHHRHRTPAQQPPTSSTASCRTGARSDSKMLTYYFRITPDNRPPSGGARPLRAVQPGFGCQSEHSP